ncbi:MAG TPA: SUF system Fe-S cluster assembly regulator [Acidobacteriaceae bacterium]|jgi:FeS assembly SUF system regulator|nr:SUF system Fe-S cluster assembly regulator [Acidobacteriaceae bacterium]
MFRLNKLADYGLVVMEYVASQPEGHLHTARSVAEATHLPAPTVVKILKKLLDRGLLVSHRGVKGGYMAARASSLISVAEVIEAIDGPLGLTECATAPGRCELEGRCRIEANFRVIGRLLHQTLRGISLSDLTALLNVTPKLPNPKNILTSISLSSGGVQ